MEWRANKKCKKHKDAQKTYLNVLVLYQIPQSYKESFHDHLALDQLNVNKNDIFIHKIW